jgi:hypothetical protein
MLFRANPKRRGRIAASSLFDTVSASDFIAA